MMASYQEGPSLEFCLGHKREQSQDSGAYIDWNSEDSASPVNNSDAGPSDDFITVVAVENGGGNGDGKGTEKKKKDEASFVTILAIGDGDEGSGNVKDVEEEVLVYRLPGERLGFGLKFEGGTNTAENVKRLFIQSSAPDSPASRAKCSWGTLVEGDEILKIDGNVVKNMTRLDCVRCLKESSVVIKLCVRHKRQKKGQPSSRIRVENAANSVSSSSPTVVSAEMKKNIPPPPPVPPRKITKKYPKETSVNPPEGFSDSPNEVSGPMPKTRTIQNSCSTDEVSKNSSKFVIRVPQKGGDHSPETSSHSLKRNSSDLKIAPPEPKVYLDLLAQEETRNGESESDDTCSTVSTVVGLSSMPTTTNSSFSDLRSSASSFCDSTNPSAPNSEPTTPVLELSRMLPQFDHLQNNDFLFYKLINGKEQENAAYEDKNSTNADDMIALQPPLNFQDAPLSYGNEEMRATITENLTMFQEETHEGSQELSYDFDHPSEEGKLRDKLTKDSKKPSLIPRLAKTIGLLSPPKPSPRKEPKLQEGNKSRFHKRKPPPQPPLPNGNGPLENGTKILKSSIPYLKKKKNKTEDFKKAAKKETPFKMDDINVKQELMSASDAAVSNAEDMIEITEDVTLEKDGSESPETNANLTWQVPNFKNFTENNTNESEPENLTGQDKENIKGLHQDQHQNDGNSNGLQMDGNVDSQYMFLWSGSKHLETIGEDEEEITVDEMAMKSVGGDMELEKAGGESGGSEFHDGDGDGDDSMIIKEECDNINLENTTGTTENPEENEEKTSDPIQEETSPPAESKSNRFDESETTGSKHPDTLCSSHVLVKLDNDSLEAVKKAVDLNDSNGDLKEAMVPVVSTAVGLVASTSSFRMPPDGHEFPQKYSEKVHDGDATSSVKMTIGLQSDEVDAGLPPLPSSEPPSVLQNKFLSPIFNDGDDQLHAAMRKSESAAIPKPPRNSFWRQDEKSEKSVRDKIAMFSSVPDSGPGSGPGPNLSKYKSSEDVFYSEEPECNRNIQNGKLFSRSVMTLDKVTGPVNPYAKKHSFGDAPMAPRSLDYTNRTQSSVDLSCSSSSAYSSSCSPDSSLSSNSSSYLGYSSTLPRKKTRNEDNKSEKKEAPVQRTTSFSVHGRSQSLLDMNPTSYRSKYLSEGFSEEGNRKSGALNLLMEQRRKNLTKLRGLVIPEKLGDSAPTDPIVDLPEIRSRDSILNSKVSHAYKEKNVPQKWSKSTLPEVAEPKLTPTHLWDMQNKTPNIPKYSPAFKRKSISVFGAKEPLSLNIKKDITVGPLSKSAVSEPSKVPVKPPRNLPLVRQNSVCEDRKYQDAFTSNLCETEIGFPGEKAQITKSTDYIPKRKPILQGRYRLHSDVGRSEEDSDNDSAVSSSRSSISHGFSPPASPLLGSQYQDVEDPGQRSGCPLSPDRITLTRSMLVPSGAACRDPDPSNKRILKPQSVEAINRKNVLTSAKFSRGFDLKSGSPLIQRRFSKEMGENGVNNPDFPNTLNQALSSGNKYAKDSPYKGKIEKIAYITDVVDETVDPDQITKKKVERSESVPLAVDTRVTTRKSSVPLDYSWASEESWNKSFEQVPINLKETLNSRSSFDKPDERSSVLADKDFSFSNLKIRNGKNLTDGVDGPVLSGSNDLTPVEKLEKAHFEPKGTRGTTEKLLSSFSSRSVSVNDIRRTFEKADAVVPSPVARTAKTATGTGTSSVSPQNGLNGNHTRMSSLDSTTSDDGPYGYSSNLLREQFGSITSLASSTSLISPQELQILIEEANQTLEESGNVNGGSSSNNHDVLVLILHRDTVGGSIGITLAGGADYESKEITVHKVLAGSPADRDGRIQKGDRILSINGKSMKGVTHRESLAILKSPRLEVVLVVSRLKGEPNPDIANSDDSTSLHTRSSSSRPPRIYERSTLMESDELSVSDPIKGPPVTLHLIKDGAGLGFSLEGGKDCSTGDRPLVIKKIFTGGVAEKCGQLKAGDELLNINGIDVSVMSRIDAWKLMKRLPDGNVTITVKRQARDEENTKCHGYVTKA